MYRIAIVDDEALDAAALREKVERFFEEREKTYVIHTFSDGLELIRTEKDFEIAFLDIKMNKLDGMDTARLLRKVDEKCILIFVTRMAQFAIHGYEVDALDFIIKPADQVSVDYVLEKAVRKLDMDSGLSVKLKTNDGAITVSTNDIYYVEVYGHDLIYHTTNGDYKVRGRLRDVAEKLEQHHFLCSNRSYLVNLRYLTGVLSDSLLVNGVSIPISRSHRKEFAQYFMNYVGENL